MGVKNMKYNIVISIILIISSNFIGCIDDEITYKDGIGSNDDITYLTKQLDSIALDNFAQVTLVEYENDTLLVEITENYGSKEKTFALECDLSSVIVSYFEEKPTPKAINYKMLIKAGKKGLMFNVYDSVFTWDDIVKMSNKEMSMITWSQNTASYIIRDEVPLSEDTSKENVKSVLINRFDLISSYESVISYENGILEIEVIGIYTDLDTSVYPVEVKYSIEIVDAFKNADKPDRIIFTMLCDSFDVNAEYEVRETSLNWTDIEKLSNEDMSIISWASKTKSYDIPKQT